MSIKKRKIIHLLCHTFDNDAKRDHHVFQTFGARLAQNIVNFSQEYECEVWYAIHGLKKKQIIKRDGITYKLYPARTLNKLLQSYFAVVSCPSLFSDLKKEDHKNTIIHFQGERGMILHTLLSQFPQFNLVLQYHGYGQPKYLDWIERVCFTSMEKRNFKNIKHFFVPIVTRVDYLTDIIGINREKISFENSPIDYSLFRLHDKKKSRKSIGIPDDAYVILYVGGLVRSKGVDKTMQAYVKLKKTYPKLYLLFVGANKRDELFEQASTVADKIVERIDHTLLPVYYCASDLFCFYGSEKNIRFAGPGIAPTEALVCNVKVVSTNLIHFPKKIVPMLGDIPNSYVEFLQMIERTIRDKKKEINTRKIVEPYVSTTHVMKNVLKVYASILGH